jgi:hypothetical protein
VSYFTLTAKKLCGALVLANDARPRLAIGTKCNAVVLGVKVRQEPSSVSLCPPLSPAPDAGPFFESRSATGP